MDRDRVKEKLEDVLTRDVNNLFQEVSKGSLSANGSRALISYLEYIHKQELDERKASKDLMKLSQEELEAEARKLIK